ncbi:hypothetical protein K3N28_19530 [Glycomyces sp. TRM65418]|uniref:hypothetical protein n=1 Tax=Glycomyces sp. TRM65418 TaxID=2867006 RepID=UPI001CE53B66|nr:hypothetical protein [Glycomyces sp. TRM65418]MCC3765254.1 hypothetical protein [Glycomyces sp. TRM65418]QZD54875.1 hypothetical protein K3N28_19435 [Glycomyces sp. TRM65418]
MSADEVLAHCTRPGPLPDADVRGRYAADERIRVPERACGAVRGALEPVAADRSDRDVRFGAYPTPKE